MRRFKKIFKRGNHSYVRIIVYACTITSLASLGLYFYYFSDGFSHKENAWSSFGEYIGGVLGGICALGSVLLIYLTFRRQVEIQIIQQFEPTFFSLLSIQREIIRTFSGGIDCYGSLSQRKEGLEFIESCSDSLKGKICYLETDNTNAYIEVLKVKINEEYNIAMKGNVNKMDYYLRNLEQLVNYIMSSGQEIDKNKYIGIIKGQMSHGELYLCYVTKHLNKIDQEVVEILLDDAKLNALELSKIIA